jgi:hypothetical protein
MQMAGEGMSRSFQSLFLGAMISKI